MAHGFLTPTPVSGDNFWRNVEWLWKKLNKEKEEKEEKEKGGALATTPKPDIYDPSVKAVRVTEVGQKQEPKAATMLKGSPVAKMIGAGSSNIVAQGRPALPPAAPSKGGTFTNIPGISAAPKKLDSEVFFKAAQTGVDPETGRYLSSEERKDYLKKSKSQMNATASVASAGASGISSASLVTKGDEAVVGSVENLTKVVTSLVDAVKAQTAAQKQISDKEAAKADTLANRALARDEEKSLEGAVDNSGFLTPSGGIQLGGNAAQGGMGGGAGGGPGLGFGGKVAANAIAKRGIGRMATRYGAKVAGKQGAKMGSKIAGKLGLKALGIAGKKVPLLGLGLGGLFAAGRAMRGDWAGAGMELASGAASTVPGFGTAASLGIDAALMAKDAASGMARGGLVTGGKKSVVDDVPIRADEGEVVMSNSAGNAWGRGTLLAMNAMGGGANKPTGGKGYAEGGLVGGDKAKSKQMFKLFGEGMIDAQKANSRDFAKIQSQGLRQYYENEGGAEKLGKGLANVWSKISGVLGGLFSGTLTSLLGGAAQAAPFGNPADYLDGGIGGSTAERNAAAFLSTLEGGGGQTAADTFQVMLNRTANAKSGGSMKAYGTTLFDQITAQGQFSPFAAAIYDRKTGDDAADAKYGKIREKLGKNAAERKAKLLEIAGKPNGLAELQKLFGAGSGSEASKVLADFETSGAMSKSSAQFVGGAMSFRGYQTEGSRRRSQGGNYFFGAAQGTKAASLNAVSTAPSVLSTGRLPALPKTGTMHGQAYGAGRDGGRKHAGVDFDISGNEKFYSRIGGTVVKIGYDPSGYGNYVDIYNEQLKVTERIAEGAKVLVQQGQKVSAGTPIVQGETDTGVIHYEIRKGQGGFGFSGTVNPLNFLASATSKNPDVAAARPAGGGQGGSRGSGSSPGSLQAAPANQNTGASLAQASGQVSMMAMGMNTPTGNIINNIYGGPGGQQASPMSNSLSPGATASNTLFNWKAARR
jgi:murein DD-endopeptidase MepM/ murein hydrolase activator NlpD